LAEDRRRTRNHSLSRAAVLRPIDPPRDSRPPPARGARRVPAEMSYRRRRRPARFTPNGAKSVSSSHTTTQGT
jgi:hypothetical protein